MIRFFVHFIINNSVLVKFCFTAILPCILCFRPALLSLGDVADKRFRLFRSMSPFRDLFVSVTFVHYAQTAGYWHDFFCIRQLHVTPRWRYNLAYIGQPFPTQILPQNDPLPVDLSVGDILLKIAAEWSEIAQWLQWRVYRKSQSLFRMVPSLTHPRPPIHPKWGFLCIRSMSP